MIIDNNIKYIIFDIGGVLADPHTGHWFITPNFFNILPDLKNKTEELKNVLRENNILLDMRNIDNVEEEAKLFYNYYKKVLEDLKYKNRSDSLLEQIVTDIVHNDNKFKFYSDVKKSLERLSAKYCLGILSDGWPSSYRLLKNNKIDNYFTKILISSVYGCIKKDGIFFDILIKTLNIKPNEAIFIDDHESNLDIAYNYDFIPLRMNRTSNNVNSKYTIITSLNQIIIPSGEKGELR